MEQIVEMQNIWRQFNTLPAEAKREVIDFIAFLQTRHQRSNLEKRSPAPKLSEDPFVGIWKDREDMNDSVAWVRDVRKREWAG